MTPRKHYKALYLNAWKLYEDEVESHGATIRQRDGWERDFNLCQTQLATERAMTGKWMLVSVGCGIVTLLAVAFAARVIF